MGRGTPVQPHPPHEPPLYRDQARTAATGALRGTRRHQELDPETGLYAFPARNYDPRTSRWLSADPALVSYLPNLGQLIEELPGEGGVFDPRNLAVYHYGGNSPLRYTDPTGGFKDGSAARELLNAAQQNPGATAAVAAAVVKLGPLALLGLAMLALQGSEVDSGGDDSSQTLYHYSPNAEWECLPYERVSNR